MGVQTTEERSRPESIPESCAVGDLESNVQRQTQIKNKASWNLNLREYAGCLYKDIRDVPDGDAEILTLAREPFDLMSNTFLMQ